MTRLRRDGTQVMKQRGRHPLITVMTVPPQDSPMSPLLWTQLQIQSLSASQHYWVVDSVYNSPSHKSQAMHHIADNYICSPPGYGQIFYNSSDHEKSTGCWHSHPNMSSPVPLKVQHVSNSLVRG